ncbi:MAG: hypothetical protein JO170_11045 [Verrucomicrobia bacterium]|nr:hypothetical protein [Verrucomicrobiota bacterium]
MASRIFSLVNREIAVGRKCDGISDWRAMDGKRPVRASLHQKEKSYAKLEIPMDNVREIASNDSRSVMDEVAAALQSRQVGNSENAELLELPDPGGHFRWEK